MKRRSPTLEGFQIMFRLPLLGLAEIGWRWTFGLAATAALFFAIREYLLTLPITPTEMFLLRTRQPILIVQALSRIFQGSAPRLGVAAVVLSLALAVGWVALASIGRAATLKATIEYFRERLSSEPGALPFPIGRGMRSLVVLNSLRAATMLAATAGLVGAVLLARASISAVDPSPTQALLIFWVLAVAIGLICSLLNWYLSLAAIFVVNDGASTLAALSAATSFCRARPGPLAAAATWFGLAHAVAFVIASSAAAFPLGFAEMLPGGVTIGGLLLVSLLYFAVVDFLYVGRLASYVFMIEPPEPVAETLNVVVSPLETTG